MFEKRKDNQPNPVPQDLSTATSDTPGKSPASRSAAMIGQTIKVKGSITGNENLIIEGTVDGSVDIPQHDLTIGESGQVTANVNAKTVKVDGQVTGDVVGTEKVIISKTGRVNGNLIAPRVTLEDGA